MLKPTKVLYVEVESIGTLVCDHLAKIVVSLWTADGLLVRRFSKVQPTCILDVMLPVKVDR
jgi:hypothetical protein